MKKHLSLVAALQIGFGAMGLLVALLMFVLFLTITGLSGDPRAFSVGLIVGSIVGLFVAVLSLPSIVGGIGLLAQQRWARIVTMIAAVFQLTNIPVGTVVAIYTFWVLMQDETEALFAGASAPAE